VRFAVLGDAGRGDAQQYETAAELTRWHDQFPFGFVLVLGDNIYGPGTSEDFALRFDILPRSCRMRRSEWPGGATTRSRGRPGYRWRGRTRLLLRLIR